jgi:hypothetical protein
MSNETRPQLKQPDSNLHSTEVIMPAPAEPQYDPTVPPIEDTIQAIAAQVPQEDWDKLYAERTVRLADVLAVVEEYRRHAEERHEAAQGDYLSTWEAGEMAASANIAERIAALGGGSSE